MINLDAILIEFVKYNWMTLGVCVMFLKGLSDVSPWEWDNKVINLIQSMLSGIKRNG